MGTSSTNLFLLLKQVSQEDHCYCNVPVVDHNSQDYSQDGNNPTSNLECSHTEKAADQSEDCEDDNQLEHIGCKLPLPDGIKVFDFNSVAVTWHAIQRS